MTSRPATPESDTLARSIELRLAQAQIDLRRKQSELDCAQENFHVTNQAYVKADAERVQAQARVAELEKALEDAANALYNDFEPDNQSRAYHAARNALKDRA